MRKTLINKANAVSYLTEDHRAFTKNDCELITDLPEQAQETVFAWIRHKPPNYPHYTSIIITMNSRVCNQIVRLKLLVYTNRRALLINLF